MKFVEIKEKKAEELDQLESNLRQELSSLQLSLRMGQTANFAKVKSLKKDIARILTSRKIGVTT